MLLNVYTRRVVVLNYSQNRHTEWRTIDIHMWQSQIKIEYYSVAYFERVTEFDAL